MSGALSSYRVTETLREAEQAVFYRALDAAEQPVVLEVLRDSGPNPRDLGRFENEYRLGNALATNAIVHPIAVGRFEGRAAIVREEVRGTSLDRLRGVALPTGRFLTLALGAARALREVHAAGLIHRDIKPANLVADELTGHVRLADFGLAMLQPREQSPAINPASIEGTLAYMSPEQTGRMNRAVDQRSDLYSLGVTFYELLTGALPFAPTDPLEWVHCHLARSPAAPSMVMPGVPEQLSRIVMRLLAKAAEDRYQSATGLVRDLELCRKQWVDAGRLDLFPVAAQDVSDRWQLPQRLYGREAEVQVLFEAFEAVAEGGGPILMLVSGYEGAGKSALVNELNGPIVRKGGVFLSGKFDPYTRDLPYAAFVQALRALILDVLTESDQGLSGWRERFQGALGPHGQVLVELVPVLELVIGKQPPLVELGPVEAQARLALVFRRLLRAIAAPERPLVLFLDDLQWADPGSLRLLEQTMADGHARDLMVIGAYRDNVVDSGHPLTATLEKIRGAGARMRGVRVGSLAREDVALLTSSLLHRDREEVDALAGIVHDKTGGNPFFARQFLTTLYRDGLIVFDRQATRWRWDLSRIAAQDFTRNVAEFMVGRLVRLSDATRRVLAVGAFVGASWDVALIAAVVGGDPNSLSEVLYGAMTEGLLARRDGSYRFTHDRVRQAAYESVPQSERPALHLRVGRMMLERTPPEALGEVIFEVVYQLNLGAAVIEDPALRRRVAELDLRAGRLAKRSAAYASANGYLTAGAALMAGLPRDELAFELELENAECQLLDGHHDSALALLAALLERAADARQRVAVYRARQGAFQLSGQVARAVEDELAGLRACGIEIPSQPTTDDVAAARARVQALLARHPPETFSDLPALTDPAKLAAMRLSTPSFFTDRLLFFVHVARMVQMGLEHGLGDNASYWFCNYALAQASFGEYREARRLAEAAYQLARRQPTSLSLSEAALVLAQITFWTASYEDAIALHRTAHRTGLENGAPETPGMSATSLLVLRLARGDSLPEVEAEADQFLALLTRTGARDYRDLVAGLRQFARQLGGQTRALDAFDDDFDVQRFEAALTPDRTTTALCWYWIYKLRATYQAGDIPQALAVAARASELMWSSAALPPQREFVLYHGLTLARALDTAATEERAGWEAQLRAHEQQLRGWAALNPASFAHGHLLLAAEQARVEGRFADALALYDGSIIAARRGNFALDEALAYELLAHCHRGLGGVAVAELCLREARACYGSRGALGKVRQLEAGLPVSQSAAFAPRATLVAPTNELDLLSVVQASQAISGEVTVERVTFRLMELVLAAGGAGRCLLVVVRADALVFAAEATITPAGIHVSVGEPVAADRAGSAPLSLLHYVWRTEEGVVLDDATKETRYAADEYVVQAQPRSVLCTPIRRQGQVVGLLYLENRAVSGAFTRRRLQLLELLAAQAAISLENAALLEQERAARDEAKESERRAALLAEASALLGESLDYQVVLSRLSRMLEQHIADWCVIDLAEPGLTFQEGKRPASSSDTVSIPLVARGRVLGTISLGPGRRLAAADRQLVEEIARRAAIAVENGELFLKSEEAVRLREEFLTVASHELNTPLAGLTLSVQALRDQASSEATSPQISARVSIQLADLIDRQAQRLTRLVGDLLDVTRLHQQQLTLSLETLDLGALVRDIVERFEPQMERVGCEVSSTIDSVIMVSGDRGRLEQVMLNLLSNAIKFGAGHPIEVQVRRMEGAAQVAVTDHGIGIDPARQGRIFERFERGVSTTHYGGLGLGLYICRQIVAAHGGLIRVDSQAGQGATFTVELPTARERENVPDTPA